MGFLLVVITIPKNIEKLWPIFGSSNYVCSFLILEGPCQENNTSEKITKNINFIKLKTPTQDISTNKTFQLVVFQTYSKALDIQLRYCKFFSRSFSFTCSQLFVSVSTQKWPCYAHAMLLCSALCGLHIVTLWSMLNQSYC